MSTPTPTTDKKPAALENRWSTREFWLRATHSDVLDCLSHGADPNAIVTPVGQTVLITAIGCGAAVESVQALIAAGADVNGQSMQDFPIHAAARSVSGKPEILKALIDGGANIEARGWDGLTALQSAANSGCSSPEPLCVLLDARANVHALTATGKRTVMHLIASAGNGEQVSVLVASGANPHVGDILGRTPMHFATGKKAAEVIPALLVAGASIEALNNHGNTPLHQAVLWCSAIAVEALIKANANIEAQNYNGWRPLHYAASYGGLSVVTPLVDAGADMEARNNSGQTPAEAIDVPGHVVKQEVKEFLESRARAVAQATHAQGQNR